MTTHLATRTPTYGHPVRRDGKPYLWCTWIAKLLGGDVHCQWAAWFKAHYKYAKIADPNAANLVEWNREHTALMAEIRQELADHGWTCAVEDDNSFRLEGAAATLGGKPDLIGRMPGHLIVIDGKTGRRRDSDTWQVLIYLYAILLLKWDVGRTVTGEVRYRASTGSVPATALTPERTGAITRMIHLVASETPPGRTPSRYDCGRCDISREDCPARVVEQTLTTEAF
jgi:hypothetical protein